jgi:3-hydroxyacyl-CoA dehydrogenase/enoyl-CoA hydratase/3-hydroxybutyryl-CoA epimerase
MTTSEPGLFHRVDADGILWVTFDSPGRALNLLTSEILVELDRLFGRADRGDFRGVVLTSGKPGVFVAGMDVDQIATVTDAHRGAEAARYGQAVFQRIAELPLPTVCAIGGTCLGGGTELALACDLRIAADDPTTKIGLPEVQLGIIPGFGGTQRLPRLVGLAPALDLILTGRTLSPAQARRVGLVDLVVPQTYVEREAAGLVRRAIAQGVPATVRALRRRRPFWHGFFEGVGPARGFVLAQTRKRTARRVAPRDYPAPLRAIEAIEAAFTRPLHEGLDLESRIVGELIASPASKNLIWLFKSRSAVKSDRGGIDAPPRPVRRLAVLGAGIMGGGIAQLAAQHDVPVRLKDVRPEALLLALRTARAVWQRRLAQGRTTEQEIAQKMAFIAPTTTDTGLRHADLVIEAVVESLEVKRAVLAEAERHLSDRAVFASNTSSLPIGEIAARALRPERVVGMHFFNPVHRMPLVEVIAGRNSSPEALATVHALATLLGKVPVVVRDGPGFLVNRILTFYLDEALRLLAEGVRIEAIDGAMTAFGMPVGPLALLDQVGLDTAQHVAAVLREAFSQRTSDGALLQAVVASGRLGEKNQRGFYRYRAGKRTTPDPGIYAAAGSPARRDLPPETLQERMVLAMVNEAVICLEEGIVREPRDIDVAMVMGTGFPPFRGGLLRHADQVGIPIVADRLSRLAEAHGGRFGPARLVQRMVREQRRFYRS